MKIVLLSIIMLVSFLHADIWKKMFHVERVDSSPKAQYDYGFRVGYDEVMNGQPVVIQPSYDYYGTGYIDGRSKAYYDIRRMNGGLYQEQPVIIMVNPHEENSIFQPSSYQSPQSY